MRERVLVRHTFKGCGLNWTMYTFHVYLCVCVFEKLASTEWRSIFFEIETSLPKKNLLDFELKEILE